MMKLAVIFESSPFDRKGLFNAVHNRVKHLIATGECEIDVYCVHSRDNAFTRKLRHTPSVPSVDSVTIDGIVYKMLWYRFSILDYALLEKLHVRPWLFRRFLSSHVGLLKGYDAVVAHSFSGALFAYKAGVPYYVTWHGSDVHTHPWRVPVILEDTKTVMESARCNFFVSKALMEASDRITVHARKEVLYNGVSEDFVEFSPAEKASVRGRYGLSPEDKVVAFVGNLVPVKNVMVLPELFAKIASGFSARFEAGSLKFWIVGDGKLRSSLEAAFAHHGFDLITGHPGQDDPNQRPSASHSQLDRGSLPLSFRPNEVSGEIRLFGNVPPADMPGIMNCVDLLVLPSLNEGLPLVCAEALRCGADVVGSDVGGISEVIGEANVVPLGDGFIDALSAKALSYLAARAVDATPILASGLVPLPGSVSGGSRQPLSEDFSWPRTAARELDFLKF